MKRIIRLPVVESKTGLKHSAIYEKMAPGQFPRQVPLGAKAVGWLEHEIDAWIDARAAERDAARVVSTEIGKIAEAISEHMRRPGLPSLASLRHCVPLMT